MYLSIYLSIYLILILYLILYLFVIGIPPISKLQNVVKVQIDKLLNELPTNDNKNNQIDSRVITRLTISCFIEYIFNVSWDKDFEILVDASYEWRKEIR
jgi:hypothetical protein